MARKATKSSIRRCASHAENRVSMFLWGEYRDWKDDHDKKGLDADGITWTCEVKNWAWPRGIKRLWHVLEAALTQAMKYDESPLKNCCFAVLIPPGTEVEYALVMHFNQQHRRVLTTLQEFKETVLRLRESDEE